MDSEMFVLARNPAGKRALDRENQTSGRETSTHGGRENAAMKCHEKFSRFAGKALSSGATVLAAVLTLAAGVSMLPPTASAQTGTILFGPFTPTPSGGGRAVALDGEILYYTFTSDSNIHRVGTDGVSSSPIPNDPDRGFTCGALSFDGVKLWCGTYDGTGRVFTIDPGTGMANLEFNHTAFGPFLPTNCFGQPVGFIDGLAFDRSDGTVWISDDGDVTLYHVNPDGTLIGAFDSPFRFGGPGSPGCNAGIAVLPGNLLALVLLAFDGGEDPNHYIALVSKADPSGTPALSFETLDPFCCEGLSFDGNTFAPRRALWANGPNNAITAFEISPVVPAPPVVAAILEANDLKTVEARNTTPGTQGPTIFVTDDAVVTVCTPEAGAGDVCNTTRPPDAEFPVNPQDNVGISFSGVPDGDPEMDVFCADVSFPHVGRRNVQLVTIQICNKPTASLTQ